MTMAATEGATAQSLSEDFAGTVSLQDREGTITSILSELSEMLQSSRTTCPKAFRKKLFRLFELNSLVVNDPVDGEENTLLHLAVKYKSNQPELSAILFQYGADMFAKNAGQVDTVQSLNSAEIDSFAKRKLDELFRKYAPGVVRAVQRNSAQCLRKLANSWCRLDMQVHVTFRGPVSLAEQHLVGKFIDLENEENATNQATKSREEADHCQSHQIERVIDIVRYAEMLECGVDVLRLLRDAAPSIHLAHFVLVGDVAGVRSLLTRNAKLQSTVASESATASALASLELRSTRVDVDVKNLAHYSATPLFYAVRNANDAIVTTLLRAGARLDHILELADGRELPVVFAVLERDVPLHMVLCVFSFINEFSKLDKASRRIASTCSSVNDVEVGWKQRIDTLHADGDTLLHYAARRSRTFDEAKLRLLLAYASPRALAARNVRNETIRDVLIADNHASLLRFVDYLLIRRLSIISEALQARDTSSLLTIESKESTSADGRSTKDAEDGASSAEEELMHLDVSSCWTYLTDLVLLGYPIDDSLCEERPDIDRRVINHFMRLRRLADELVDAVERGETVCVRRRVASLFGSPHSLVTQFGSELQVHVHAHPLKLVSSRDGQPILHKAVLRNNVELTKMLLTFSTYNANNYAIEGPCEESLAVAAVEGGSNDDFPDSDSCATIITSASTATISSTQLTCNRRESNEERSNVAKLLLNSLVDNYRRTALFYAVIGGAAYRRLANLLVEWGANEYVTDRQGVAPAHLAAARSGLFVASNRELDERRRDVQKFIDYQLTSSFLRAEEPELDVRTLF